jgi:hypothetical protein
MEAMMTQPTPAPSMAKLCPNCMAPNDESAHLCRICMTPLSAHAATDPMLSISARADTFGKAARSSRSPIVLIGVWLLMGPIAGVSVMGFFSVIKDPGGPGSILALLPLGLFAFIYIGLLWRTTSNFRRTPDPELPDDPLVREDDDAPQDSGDEADYPREDRP